MSRLELEENDSKEYKIEAICNSEIYAKKLHNGHLLDFCYLVSWKSYLEEKNTQEPTFAIQHFWRLVITFYKEHPEKPIITSPPIDLILPMAKLTVRLGTKALSTKEKRDRLIKNSDTSKQIKKD